jgi:hypothetical protein
MAINQGVTKITVGGTAITYLINTEFVRTNELRDVTNKDSTGNSREFTGGILNGTMNAEAFFEEDATYGFRQLEGLCSGGTSATFIHTSETSGDRNWSATGYVREVGKRSPNLDGSETVSVQIQLSGAVTEGTEA